MDTTFSNRKRFGLWIAVGLVALTLVSWGIIMNAKSSEQKLSWQWPADREPTAFLVAEVTRIKKRSGGLFGFRNSPSNAEYLPDAQVVAGTIRFGDNAGAIVTLDAPKMELGTIKAGDTVAMGFVDGGICICVQLIPDNVPEDVMLDWAKEFACAE